MEIIALGAINQNNKEGILSLIESYHDLIVPGLKDKETDAEKDAKELLAKETKAIFAVRPETNPSKIKSNDPRVQSLSRHYKDHKKIYDHKKLVSDASNIKK